MVKVVAASEREGDSCTAAGNHPNSRNLMPPSVSPVGSGAVRAPYAKLMSDKSHVSIDDIVGPMLGAAVKQREWARSC